MKLDCLHAPARNQYFAVLTVNLITISHGSIAGWVSPALLTLTSDKTPLKSGPMTTEQVSWFVSVIAIGGLVGVLLTDSIVRHFGNKISLIFLALPQIVWWALVAFGDQFYHLIIGRTIVGLTGGAIFRTIPIFTAEISQSHIRGIFGTMAALTYNLGVLIGFILGGYLPYQWIPLCVLLSMAYIVLVAFFIPETPQFLLSRGQHEKAFRSLLFYRTVSASKVPAAVEAEFLELQGLQKHIEEKRKVTWRAFLTKEARFAMVMSIFLSIVMQFSGHFPLMQFTATIFVESGSSLSPNNSAIIVAVVQIMGNYGSVLMVDRFGRKVLLTISCVGTALSLSTIGIYSFLETRGFVVAQFNWIPIVAFASGIFLLSIGVIAVPVTIMTEIMPAEIKGIGLTIAMIINPLLSFFVAKAFPILLVKIHVYGVMWFFSTSLIIGIIVILIFLPETKGKNLNKV